MNSSLVPRSPSRLAMSRRDVRDIAQIQAQAARSAAALRSRAYLANLALNYVHMLSMQEGVLAQRTPLASHRYAMIVEGFTVAAAIEVSS